MTSFDAPPNSTHFSDSQKLCIATDAPEAHVANVSMHTQGPGFPPHTYIFPGFPSYYPPYAPPPYPYYLPYYHQPPPDASATTHPHGTPSLFGPSVERPKPAPSPGSPQKVVLPRVVPLAEFCNHYKIDDEALKNWGAKTGMIMPDLKSLPEKTFLTSIVSFSMM